MRDVPPYGKLDMVLGTAAAIGMCIVFLIQHDSGCTVKTARIRPGERVVQTVEEVYPRSLLPGERIPINTADRFDLGRLPGIGDDTAQAIVDFRDRHGPFRRVEQIRRVRGIDDRRWAQIEDYICLDADTD